MKRRIFQALLGSLAILALYAMTGRSQTPAIPDPIGSGQELAERLRKSGPSQSASFTGSLIVTRPERTRTISIASTIAVGATNWQVRYIAGTNASAETLTIVRSPSSPNQYYSSGSADGRNGKPLGAADLYQPFAGSDFWRIDLGLDFFFWPEQRQINSQMRRGRACRVLESRNPKPLPGGYGRVVSWIDVETDGILKAEAYDHQDQLIKEFLVGSFRKVDGQYQLEEMTIRIPKSRNETTIRFDLDR